MQSSSKKSSVNETRKIRSRTLLPANNKSESLVRARLGARAVDSVEMLKEFSLSISDLEIIPQEQRGTIKIRQKKEVAPAFKRLIASRYGNGFIGGGARS